MSPAPVLVIPDVLPGFLEYLRAALADSGWAGLLVVTEVPRDRPGVFVRVRFDGLARPSVAYAVVTVTVESWARSESEATALGAVCYGLACTTDLPGSYAYAPRDATILGPHPSPDPDSGQARSVCAVRLVVPVETI